MNKFWSQLERLTGWLLCFFTYTLWQYHPLIHYYWSPLLFMEQEQRDITDAETAGPWGAGEMDHIFESKENHFHPLDLYRTKLCSQSKDQNGTRWTLSRQFYQSLLGGREGRTVYGACVALGSALFFSSFASFAPLQAFPLALPRMSINSN